MGKPVAGVFDGHEGVVASSTASSQTAAAPSSSASVNPTRVVPAASSISVGVVASATVVAGGKECHTHADGVQHCV